MGRFCTGRFFASKLAVFDLLWRCGKGCRWIKKQKECINIGRQKDKKHKKKPLKKKSKAKIHSFSVLIIYFFCLVGDLFTHRYNGGNQNPEMRKIEKQKGNIKKKQQNKGEREEEARLCPGFI